MSIVHPTRKEMWLCLATLKVILDKIFCLHLLATTSLFQLYFLKDYTFSFLEPFSLIMVCFLFFFFKLKQVHGLRSQTGLQSL